MDHLTTPEEWIHTLGMQKHPEGGYFVEIYRSMDYIPQEVLPEGISGKRCFSTSIYFLLTKGDISVFHTLQQDEIWHFYAGDPLNLHIIYTDGTYTKIILGQNFRKKHVFQVVIPGGSYFGAECAPGGSYSLTGCTVAPGFEFDDLYIPGQKELCELFPQHKEIIQKLTKGNK